MQTKLDKAFKIIVDISNRKVTIPQAISWYVTDENIAHLYCQIIDEVEDSIIDIQSYKLSMRVLTPSKILKEVNYTLSDITNNIFTLALPDELITEKGRHQCELSIEYLGDKLTSEPFNYNIIQSIANQLDSTISKDSHYPLVLELEDKLKEWNNILDEQVSKVIILNNDVRNAEKTRQANETQRIEAENARQEGYVEFKNEVGEELASVNSQLEHKASKNEVFSMSNMGQDIREAMTGGSIAVVGVESVLNENIVNNQVCVEKIDFCNIKGNLINLNSLQPNKCIVQYPSSPFQLQDLEGYYSYKFIAYPNTKYTFKDDTISGALFIEYDSKGNKKIYRHMSILLVKEYTFTTTAETKYIIISFPAKAKNNVFLELGDSVSCDNYSIQFDDNVNVVTKEDFNEIKEKLDVIGVDNIDYNYFAQIENGFLVCKIPSTTKVSYNGLDIGSTGRVHKFLVQLAFENKPNSNPATATLISTKLGYRYVSNITDKSLHLCFGQDSMHIDLFDSNVMNTFGNYTYSTPCLKDGKTLYKIGWEYVDEDNVKVYMPDGTTQNFVMPNDKKVSDYAGRYNIIEHFTQNNNGSNISGAMFKKIALWRNDDIYRPLIFDDFEKANGSIGVTRSGHIYHQMILNNSDYANF